MGPEVLLVHGGASPATTWSGLEALSKRWTLAYILRTCIGAALTRVHSRLSVGTKRADQSVPAQTQHLVDVLDKRLRIAVRRAELTHRRVRELCLANVELTYRGDLRGHFAEA